MHIINAFLRLTRTTFSRARQAFNCEDTSDRYGESSQLMGDPEQTNDPNSHPSHESHSLTGRFHSFNESWRAFFICIFHATIYYTAAIIGYSFLADDKTFINSFYMATVIFTTIGYGDQTPTTSNSKLFSIALATYGVIILGIFIGVAGQALVDRNNQALQKQRKRVSVKIMAALTENETVDFDESQYRPSRKRPLIKDILEIMRLEAPIALVVVAIAVAVGYYEGWTLLDSVYWACISGYTIGFGDIAPVLPETRIFCCFFLPFIVAVLGEILSRIASTYMRRKQHDVEESFLRRSLTMCDLETLDHNCDGRVDRAEFLTYMLVALQKVEKTDIDDILSTFDRLDRDHSGYLTSNDLQTVRRQVRRSVYELNHQAVQGLSELFERERSGNGSRTSR